MKNKDIFPFGLCDQEIKVDGKITDGEYPCIQSGLIDVQTHTLSHMPSRIASGADKNNIYFAAEIKLPKDYRFPTISGKNDSAGLAAASDMFCLVIRSDNNIDAKAFTAAYITVLADGRYYDAIEKVDWKIHNLEYRNSSAQIIKSLKNTFINNKFTVEMVIPREKLGISKNNQFCLAFGFNVNKKRITWKDHSMWFDAPEAFSQAIISDVNVNIFPGKLNVGEIINNCIVSNPASTKNNYKINSKVLVSRIALTSKEAVDDQLIDAKLNFLSGNSYYKWNTELTLNKGDIKTLQKKLQLQSPDLYIYDFAINLNGKKVMSRRLPFVFNPPLAVSLEPLPSKDKIIVKGQAYNLNIKNNDKLHFEFYDKDGNVVFNFKSNWKTISKGLKFSMKSIPVGKYQVKVKVYDENQKLTANTKLIFEKQKLPDWLLKPKGIEALKASWCPSPWTPIDYNNQTVKVWGRTIKLGNKGLIEQISSQGENTLLTPMAIKYICNDKILTLNFGKPNMISHDRGRIVFALNATSPDLQAKISATVEFDGLLKLNLDIIPNKNNFMVDKLWLEYSVADAELFFMSTAKVCDEYGKTDNLKFKKPFYLWVGNEKRGINWFTENYKNWLVNSQKPRIEMTKSGTGTTVKLLLANEQSVISNPMNICMGFHPTPTKPQNNKWRRVLASCMSGFRPQPVNLVMIHPNAFNAYGSLHPTVRSENILKQWQQIRQKQGQEILVSLAPYLLGTDERIRRSAPLCLPRNKVAEKFYYPKNFKNYKRDKTYDYFKAEWRMMPEKFYPSNPHYSPMAYLSPKTSWTDYLVDKAYRIVSDYKLDGIYFDLAAPRLNGDPSHSYSYTTKDGKVESSVEIYASRNLFKRLYEIFQKLKGADGTTSLICHSHAVVTPCSSFWDYVLSGEGMKAKKPYQYTQWACADRIRSVVPKVIPINKTKNKNFDPACLRLQISQRLWGVPVLFLPQYDYVPKLRGKAGLAREVISLLLLHDAVTNTNWLSSKVLYKFYTTLRLRFNMTNVEFFPYWSNSIKSSNKAIKVSYYKHKNKYDYLLVVANLSNKIQNTTLALPEELRNCQLFFNIEKPHAKNMQYEYKRTGWQVKVPAHDFKVYRFMISPQK